MTNPEMLRLLADKIRASDNFTFTKLGDGELYCMLGHAGGNCDGHPYSPELGEKLSRAFASLSGREDAYVGRQDALASAETEAFVRERGLRLQFCDCNLLLHYPDTLLPEMRAFYAAVKASPRRKVFVGPARLRGVCGLLSVSEFVEVPLANAFSRYDDVLARVRVTDDCVVLLSAGMMSKALICDLSQRGPSATYVDLGSAFDPMFVGTTRSSPGYSQVDQATLRAFYAGLAAPTTLPFSVVAIARNEAKTLPRLAASLAEFRHRGGTMHLLDTGSTDGTPETARGLGFEVTEVGDAYARVISEGEAAAANDQFVVAGEAPIVKAGERFFDFSAARNHAASLAPTDLVAMCDCDEVYTHLDVDHVSAEIAAGAGQFHSHFVFQHDADGKPELQFLHSKFYDRTKLYWRGTVHEVLQRLPGTPDFREVHSDPSVVFLEHWQNQETDRSCYLTGLAADLRADPENDRNTHYLARELYYTGRYRSAIRLFDRHVTMRGWPPEQARSRMLAGDCHQRLGDEAEARRSWVESFTAFPCRQPLLRLAEESFKRNDHVQTAAWAEASLAVPRSNFYFIEERSFGAAPHERLYWAYYYLGRRDDARRHFDLALSHEPQNGKLLHDARFFHPMPSVSVVLPTLGRPEGLARALASIRALNYDASLVEVIVDDGPGTVPVKVNRMVEKAKNDWVLFAANDVEFDPQCLVQAVLAAEREGKRLVAFNTGLLVPGSHEPPYGNICEHFMVRRDLLPLVGGVVFDERFHHAGCDNYLWALAAKIGEATWCETARLTHHHFSRGSAPWDEVYAEGWKNVEADRALYHSLLREVLARP